MLAFSCYKVSLCFANVTLAAISARNVVNWITSFFFVYLVFRFWEDLAYCLIGFKGHFDAVVFQNSLNWLRGPANVWNCAIMPVVVLKVIDFCLSTTNFQYDHRHYKPIHGTAMGSPVSAVMANMVMEDLEERALTSLTNQPLFWKRFVDDVSTTTKPGSDQTFLEHLNSIEPCIKFTIERESEGKIAFLDSMIHRQEDLED